MKKEFNLSEKIYRYRGSSAHTNHIKVRYVKEAVRRLKEKHMKHTNDDYMLNVIDKIFGKELT